MFKAIRITVLLLILFFVAASNWLTQSRSTDWNNSLWDCVSQLLAATKNSINSSTVMRIALNMFTSAARNHWEVRLGRNSRPLNSERIPIRPSFASKRRLWDSL